MDVGNGVDLQHGDTDLVRTTETGDRIGLKENDKIDNGFLLDAMEANGVTEYRHTVPINQDYSSIVVDEGEASVVVVPQTKTTKKAGTNATDALKRNKVRKGECGRNDAIADLQKQRAHVTQSLSLPSKGGLAGGLRKSIGDIKVVKAGIEASHPNSQSLKSKTSNEGASIKQIQFGSAPVTHKSSAVKSNVSDANSCSPLQTHPKPQKANDETLSTSPDFSAPRKSSGPIFASRLDERAEKRKEFFLKLEEKIHAKEQEKTDMQAKSKENQEAEIKMLRKSLAFKASPMPGFYKEPGPPKVELKKIPTTRPRSPKLGRHKLPVTLGDGDNASCRNLSSDVDATKSNGDITNVVEAPIDQMKPVRKFLTKLPSRKSSTTKLERKNPGIKAKVSDPEENELIPKVVELGENNSKHAKESPAETEGADRCQVNEQTVLQSSVVDISHSE